MSKENIGRRKHSQTVEEHPIPSPATIKNKEMEKQILVSKEIREKLTSKDGYGFNHVTVRKALRGDVSTLKRQQIRETALKEGGVYKN